MKIVFKILIKEFLPSILLRFFRFLNHSIVKRDNILVLEPNINEDISTLVEQYKLSLPTECLVLGNGPSLSYFIENHANFIDNKTVFCINSFVDSIFFLKIKPKFYIFADPAYWDQNCSESLKKTLSKTYDNLKVKVTWELFILLPLAAKEWNFVLDLPSQNSNVVLVYYNNNLVANEDVFIRHELYKANKAMVQCQTVLVSALFLSLNLNFKKCYLAGADMSFHEETFVNNDNIVCVRYKYFLDNEEPNVVPFWKNNENTVTFKMHELFEAFSRMFKGFTELEAYSEFLGSKIYNISIKSYIDAFERLDLDAIKIDE